MGGLKNEALAGRLCHEGEWAWKIREILLPGSQTMNTTKTVLAVCAMAGAVLGTGAIASRMDDGAKPAGEKAPATPPATPETRPDVKPDEKPVSPYVLDHKAKSIDGKEVDLETYKGKVVLIVNVASKCGFTPQYKGLEALYESKKDAGLVILGFPSNDFKQQEPGSEADIKKFCTENYGVTFPMFSKIVVKGEKADALYKDLASQPSSVGGEPGWNFTKYLVDRNGNAVAKFDSRIKPDDSTLVKRIEELLSEKAK